MVYISCSGGLGDIVQTYLSSPPQPEGMWEDGEFPSSDPTMSMWFRRLADFKAKNPGEEVKLVIASHNPNTPSFFEHNPFIDNIEVWKWQLGVNIGDILDSKYGKEACIHASYSPKDYIPTLPTVFMSQSECDALGAIVENGDYVLVHPFAGAELRMSLGLPGYVDIVKKLRKHMPVIIVGASYIKNCSAGDMLVEKFDYTKDNVLNLVNIASVRLSVALAMNCSGFVGTLSSMILPAWYSRVKSVCILGTKHDTGIPMEDFIADPNPSGWGLTQPFNKTYMIEHGGSVNVREVVDWLCG